MISETLKKLLEKQGITANRLAVKMGLPSNAPIYALVNGKNRNPSFRLMERIADVLDVSMDVFRHETGGK